MSGIDEQPNKFRSTNTNLVNAFEYRGRICVVKKSSWGYHNGYVEVLAENSGLGYSDFITRIDTDELTFGGYLYNPGIPEGMWFFGFDSGHYWNDKNPKSQTFVSVRERTKQLADEFIEKGI